MGNLESNPALAHGRNPAMRIHTESRDQKIHETYASKNKTFDRDLRAKETRDAKRELHSILRYHEAQSPSGAA